MKNSKPILDVKDLCKFFPIKSQGFFRKTIGWIRATDHVSFKLYRNEILGLVGESGCGKSTTTRTVLRALEPTSGSILFQTPEGRVDLANLTDRELRPIRKYMQMIFQDPFSSLNPRMTVGEIVSEPLKIHNLAQGTEISRRVDEMLLKVGLKPEHKQRYPHAFSGGQRQRIGIARALIMRPQFVVADEAVSALDVSIQAQIINLLADLRQEMNLAMIFVAHDLSVVRHLCDRVAVMYAGQIVELAPTEELFTRPRHPYTEALLKSVPDIDPDKPIQATLQGEVADISALPKGCAFHPRCPFSCADCEAKLPPARELSPGHTVACFNPR